MFRMARSGRVRGTKLVDNVEAGNLAPVRAYGAEVRFITS